jgi:mannose-6-phosphate isomerase-like protein (cupin superfamily)
MFRVDRPWGWELVWEAVPAVVGRVLHVRRGHRLWVDRRDRPSERLVLCSGLLTLVWEDEHGRLREATLAPGHVHEIPARTRHRLIAIEDSDLVAVGPSSEEDIVRVEEG